MEGEGAALVTVSGPQERIRSSERTRQRVLTATIECLCESGYSATTTILVAGRAGVSRGALTHQFPSRADLMVFVMEEIYHEELEIYRKIFENITDPREHLLTLPEAVWSVCARPAGMAVLEILQGARSDQALLERLRPVQSRNDIDLIAVTGRSADQTESFPFGYLLISICRGLSLRRIIDPQFPGMEDAIILFRNLVAAALDEGVLAPAA